ncbi:MULTISPECIES: ligand-binding sensor domain-containing protein [Bizionia]|uniref:Histidine kinase n=1 Tax=Bizionia algoritergicola TaxID=291187 RepID=A0A5D0QXM6_9FLAO|nr:MULTISPECIES: two-component regulator propeller domain-containing protein [Bizionia]OBX21767.1 hypothetical protein BAA08_11475 [Bizionia sp. APA-3]TYB73421.1 hypothetical protein ES675_07115 [Bizionia algoritergicola]
MKKLYQLSKICLIVFSSFLLTACNGQTKTPVKPNAQEDSISKTINTSKVGEPINSPNYGAPFLNEPPATRISDFVRNIFQDSKGNLWFGTNGDGVIRFSGKSLDYFSENEGFNGLAIRGIIEDKEGNVWFGTERGLTKYNGETFTNFNEKDGLLNSNLWSLIIDSKGLMWIGTLGGAYTFNGEKFTPFVIPESEPDVLRGVTSSKIVHCIMEDSKGSMWFGTPEGAYMYNGKILTHISEKDGLPNNSINRILEDKNHNFWFATHHKGISRYDGKTFTNFTTNGVISGDEVWNIYEDSNGNIWFPAENYGVYRYDGNTFKNYSKKDGLLTNAIQCMYEDKEGRFWFGGWMGLFRFDDNYFSVVTKEGPWEK